MGGSLSSEQRDHSKELYQLVKRLVGRKVVARKDIDKLLLEIACQCPWYPEKGTISVEEWEKIGHQLKTGPRAAAPHLIAWQAVTTAVGRLSKPSAPLVSLINPPGDPPSYNLPLVAPLLPPIQQQPQEKLGAVEAGIAEARKRGENMWEEGLWEPDSHPAMFPVTFTTAENGDVTAATTVNIAGVVPDQIYGTGQFDSAVETPCLPSPPGPLRALPVPTREAGPLRLSLGPPQCRAAGPGCEREAEERRMGCGDERGGSVPVVSSS
ncbi:hypothetical protein JD844_012736 [Phrynosoma platyrhinos]|uniref:Beta-retroviral matrix protein domain-containing protein n=1 Tax=Phrynosoma platyrhinos TaxID=52577 RepID=A0ABQ7TJZ1_PHRPL|nr:hypothetical protein JD844_012736 [Phrynosoma platyrhinos]